MMHHTRITIDYTSVPKFECSLTMLQRNENQFRIVELLSLLFKLTNVMYF